jgi:hypothetical protein
MKVWATPVGQAVIATRRGAFLLTATGSATVSGATYNRASSAPRRNTASTSCRACAGVLWNTRLPTNRDMSTGALVTSNTHSAASIVAADNCRSGCAASFTSTLVLQP